MRVYTFSEARQNFARVLELAQTEGCAQITRRDGGVFSIQPVSQPKSPFDVEGVSLGLSRSEIVAAVRESREPQSGS